MRVGVRTGLALWMAACLLSVRASGQTNDAPAAAGGAAEPADAMTEEARRAQPVVEEGFYQARVGNHARAIESFQQALSIDPMSRRAMFGLGTSYIALEQYEEAIRVLQRAIDTDRNDYFALNNLAWLHATARDIRFRDGHRAVALAREALMIAPMDYHVWSTLAEGYYISGDYAKAQRAAEEALRIARTSQLPAANVQEYELQVRRCKSAAEAMDILE